MSSPAQRAARDLHARAILRADAAESRRRILEAAATLTENSSTSMAAIAAAAGVGRSTLYRHFPTRQILNEALNEPAADVDQSSRAGSEPMFGQVTAPSFQGPGQLARDHPLALEVTRILDGVPPHLVPDQLIAEARRAAGVAVALYVVDIDGSHLLRLAGSPEFPDRIEDPPALGPEIVPEGLSGFYAQLQRQFPGCVAEPLWLRGRVTGLLLCMGRPAGSLADIARQGSAALELANDYTDFVEAARRRKPTTPAAEIQQNLFPPRTVRIAGAQLAGVLLPTYEVGGDWFDFVENRDGAWLAIADASGNGPTAAGMGAAVLGALRAARRADNDLEQALGLMHETVRKLEHPNMYVTALVARWHPATSTLRWINCGHPPAYLVDVEGSLTELQDHHHPALGTGEKHPSFKSSQRRLYPGERLILVTDGVTERHTQDGGRFGVDGLKSAVENAAFPTAAGTAMAIQKAVTDYWREPLEDDATAVVMAIA